jgi:hypothetical protein
MCRFKKSLKIVFLSGAVLLCPLVSVQAQQAVVLSDAELDDIHAGGLDLTINVLEAHQSAIASQNNIGTLFSQGPILLNGSISNTNYAQVYNVGNSALAAQSNIAVAVARGGNIDSLTIDNSNEAYVYNTAGAGAAKALKLSQLSFSRKGLSLDIGGLESSYSGVALQNNIAAVVSFGGEISNVTINNSNYAEVTNTGNTALVAQNNIAVVVSCGGSLDADTIHINNVNEAGLSNNLNGIDGKAVAKSLLIQKGGYSITIDAVSAQKSAVCVQNNIGIIATKKISGSKSDVSISNINRQITINNNL